MSSNTSISKFSVETSLALSSTQCHTILIVFIYFIMLKCIYFYYIKYNYYIYERIITFFINMCENHKTNNLEVDIDICNFQFFSHIPFLIAFIISIVFNFYEISILLGIVIVFSVLYHAHLEQINVYSYADNISAFTLSMYGNVQLFHSPYIHIFVINLTLGLTMLVVFVLGFFDAFNPYYHILHPIGMHILPAVWICIVVIYQHPILLK